MNRKLIEKLKTWVRSINMNIAAKMIEINNLPIITLKYMARKLSEFLFVNFSMRYNETNVSRKKNNKIIHT